MKFEWNAIQTGKGIPYQRDPTIQRFLGETTLDTAGKRPRVDLAGSTGDLARQACFQRKIR